MVPQSGEILEVKNLINDGSAAVSRVREAYEYVTGDEHDLTNPDEAPPIRVPSTYQNPHHGGSHGFDPRKGTSITADCGGMKFTIPDLMNLPPEIKAKMSAELAAMGDDADNQGSNFGQNIAKVFKKYASAEFNGELLPPLKTWVNGGRDPFKRKVTLPQSKCMAGLPTVSATSNSKTPFVKQGAKSMHNSAFFTANPAGNMPGNIGLAPDQTAAFASFSPEGMGVPTARTRHPQQPQHPQHPQAHRQAPPPVAQPRVVPAPDKIVLFKSAIGNIQSRYHSVVLTNGTPMINPETGQLEAPVYLILSRNYASTEGGDSFVPTSPSNGNRAFIVLADGTELELNFVMLTFPIGKVQHTVMVVSDPNSVQPNQDPLPTNTDPLLANNFAQPAAPPVAEPMSPEEAAGGMEG